MHTENRKSARRILRTDAVVTLASGQTYAGRTYDLGLGGVAVVTAVQLCSEGGCTVGFTLPAVAPVRVDAVTRIVYCTPCAEGFKTGLQFVDVTAAGLRAIEAFVTDG